MFEHSVIACKVNALTNCATVAAIVKYQMIQEQRFKYMDDKCLIASNIRQKQCIRYKKVY